MAEINLNDVIDNISHSVILNSPIHGYGLFATSLIDAETVLGYLDGQQIPYTLYLKQNLAFEWNALREDLLLVRPYRTKYSFINHSRHPNLYLSYYPLRLIALRQIEINEELLLNYLSEPLPPHYLDNHGKTYL